MSGRGKKWIIPLASTIPILAIAYAFSLGPSPHKTLQTFESVAELEAHDAGVMVPAISYAVRHPGMHHEQLALDYLEHVVADESEARPVRSEALRTLTAVAPNRAAKFRAEVFGALQ